MTLAQLQSFVLVARLGSVKAAAAELGVTEPAVSVAVVALGWSTTRNDSTRIAATPKLTDVRARVRCRASAWMMCWLARHGSSR